MLISMFCVTLIFAQSDSTKRISLQPLPSIFHTPETSWGFGATLLGFNTPKDSTTTRSNAQLFVDVTLRKQISFQSDFNIYTRNDKWYIRGSHDLSKFPEFYFGIGNNNKRSDRCLIDISYFDLNVTGYRKLKKDWYLGPRIHYQNLNHINKEIIQDGIQIGEMGYTSIGTGIGFLIDKRNNLLNPSEGYFIESLVTKYLDLSHSSKGFLNHTLDARYYKSFNKLILNTNLFTVHNQGVVPFRMMPFLGGARFLRGYYAGRFRDNNLSLFQAELRRPVFWRIGVAAFSGVGQVYSAIQEFNSNNFHFNYGGGLRFKINKNSEANIRLDYGKTKDSHGFYIVFGECF